MTDRAVYKGDRLVSTTPFRLESILVSEDGGKLYSVAWLVRTPAGLKLRRHMAPRANWTQGRFLAWASRNGFDGGSHNARDLGDIIAKMEAILPDDSFFEFSPQMGWDSSMTRFLIGQECYTEGESLPADPVRAHDQATLYLDPSVPEIMSDGFVSKGSFNGWKAAAEIASVYPRVALAIYGACLPPLMRIIGVENFGIIWSGPSSSGKSTCVALASSVWGNPDPMDPPSATMLWSDDTKSISKWAAVCRDLPVLLDDIHTKGIYGTDKRLKTALCGAEAEGSSPMHWKTVVMAAGVNSIEDDASDDPLLSRVICLWGSPFGETTPTTARDVSELMDIVRAHHGHLGPAVVQALLANKEKWGKWRKSYETARAEAAAQAGSMGAGPARLAGYIAAIATCAQILQGIMPEVFNWGYKPTIRDLWNWMALTGPAQEKSRLALDLVKEYAAANWGLMHGVWSHTDPPNTGFVGKVSPDGTVMLSYARLNGLLAECGMKPMEIYAEWLNSGKILRAGAGYVHRVTVSGLPFRGVHFTEPMSRVTIVKKATA